MVRDPRAFWTVELLNTRDLQQAAAGPPATPSGSSASSANAAGEHFITISDGHFVDGCERFYFTGWNQWEAVESGAGAPHLYGSVLPINVTAPQMLRQLMQSAASQGLLVMRTWADAVDSQYALETSPGKYNEAIFRGLDYVLVLALTTNWGDTGSVDQYVSWSGTAQQHSDFFSDANCQALYKSFVKMVLTRVNSINGRTYSEDPTIMAWNLINEPRCYQCAAAVKSWVTMMAAYVKSLDPNHLVSIGDEGFYTSGTAATNINPAGGWAIQQGQDYQKFCQIANIDYCTLHLWPDNWDDVNLTFQKNWIIKHAQDALAIGKPAMLEEYGKQIVGGNNVRNQFYNAILSEVYNQHLGRWLAGNRV
ncbi:hypothetical protein WJX73_000535 [Symbiochloris irregularis]|uniref:mannan endo-1,4-beta-mannosidase n=1 Tax=Symbiochloris irregularis TaxID=706552 RepID=A0AAW1PZS8_9CHLO